MDEIFQTLIRSIREVLPELREHQFQEEDQLKELGANSIDRVEILALTVEVLSLDIPLTALQGAHNIGELAALIKEQQQLITGKQNQL
ncbi:MAG TPA: acyl carrier protein [Chitinophaga sp.]|uniref:acyl carrier protein n=1 Tax=Chitinophaga sp. TaxID=1869181 RepID=UPI002CE09730|nr:acyl carrier protein [Chitinophaga sp.]HVI46508.1 acyl carrier protein [Chitinophaga sp.]